MGLFTSRADPAPDLLEALAEPAALIALDGRVLAANRAWHAAGGPPTRLPPPRGPSLLFATLRAAAAGDPGEADFRLEAKTWRAQAARVDDRRLLLRLYAVEGRSEPGAPDRPPAAAAASLDALAQAAPFGAALLDGPDPFASAILSANPALDAMCPGLAAPGRSFAALIDPASRVEAQGRIAAGHAGAIEVRLAGAGPRIAHLYLSSPQGRALAYLVDVSAQKDMEQQLLQTQKMQAIGLLAGGVAHDINNHLTAIQLRLDELLPRHPLGDPSYQNLSEIRQIGVRVANLVRKLLAFSRKQTVQRETLDLADLVSESAVLLRRLLREDIKLETEHGWGLPLARADRSQVETAIMNLVVNAGDALRGREGPGLVRIRTARATGAQIRDPAYAGGPGGEFALIEVADNGPGIAPDLLSKIFEPFFTTKAVGEGTGLGLSTVYGIVKQAEGHIQVDSAPGQGAAFRIFLPAHAAPLKLPEPAPAPKAKAVARDLSGVGRILFVEDEDDVRGIAARQLRARGYQVIEAADGEQALELAQLHAGQIDLMISDVIMPGIDGLTLLKRARAYLGAAPVMFISGYAEAEFSDLLEGEAGVTFLPKPLDIKTLAEKVKQRLAA